MTRGRCARGNHPATLGTCSSPTGFASGQLPTRKPSSCSMQATHRSPITELSESSRAAWNSANGSPNGPSAPGGTRSSGSSPPGAAFWDRTQPSTRSSTSARRPRPGEPGAGLLRPESRQDAGAGSHGSSAASMSRVSVLTTGRTRYGWTAGPSSCRGSAGWPWSRSCASAARSARSPSTGRLAGGSPASAWRTASRSRR